MDRCPGYDGMSPKGPALCGALLAACFAGCGDPPEPPSRSRQPLTQAQDCDDTLEPETLVQFSQKCFNEIHEHVPKFNCDDGTLVPEEHLSPGSYPAQTCDRPNVLNEACDPGSRFQVLKQTNDVTIVAHCRKKGRGEGEYGDIAVIQYNQSNGATCFYQALGTLSAEVSAPIDGTPADGSGPGKFPWMTPAETEKIHCVRCHDNGPFIRSPYLAQLRNEPKNRLPGTNPGPGRWDRRFAWNRTLPYTFVGNAFQAWKVASVSVTGVGSECTGCHRLGINAFKFGNFTKVHWSADGTAQTLGGVATNATQAQKNPHSVDSPIWMKPEQVFFDATVESEAHAIAACARSQAAHLNNANSKPPPPDCQSVQYGQGITCRAGAVRGVVNGATQSAPAPGRVDSVVELGACASGDCPLSFCYWRTLHGPFWQRSDAAVEIGGPAYRGALARIYSEGGIWKVRAMSDATGLQPSAPPGGTVECTRYNEISMVRDAKKCFLNAFAISDPNGKQPFETIVTSIAGQNAYLLSGLIGNVAQATSMNDPDVLRVSEQGRKFLLSQSHSRTPPAPLTPGPLKGESFTHGCEDWGPVYAVQDVFTDADIQLVPYPQARDVRCFVTGIAGAWSSTRNAGTVQPFAEIYDGPKKEIRFRVFPGGDARDRVGAYASCIRIK